MHSIIGIGVIIFAISVLPIFLITPYLDPFSDQKSSMCIVENCRINVSAPNPCDRFGKCNICFQFSYTYILSLNDTNYTNDFSSETTDTEFCLSKFNVTCYYDYHNISATLNVFSNISDTTIIITAFLWSLILAFLLLPSALYFEPDVINETI